MKSVKRNTDGEKKRKAAYLAIWEFIDKEIRLIEVI
jgi:hypothetical protein